MMDQYIAFKCIFVKLLFIFKTIDWKQRQILPKNNFCCWAPLAQTDFKGQFSKQTSNWLLSPYGKYPTNYVGEPLEQRLYTFCNLLQFEDEKHFFFHCTFYNDIKADNFNEQLFNNKFNSLKDIDKFKYLITNIPTAKYIVKVYLRRRNKLYN